MRIAIGPGTGMTRNRRFHPKRIELYQLPKVGDRVPSDRETGGAAHPDKGCLGNNFGISIVAITLRVMFRD